MAAVRRKYLNIFLYPGHRCSRPAPAIEPPRASFPEPLPYIKSEPLEQEEVLGLAVGCQGYAPQQLPQVEVKEEFPGVELIPGVELDVSPLRSDCHLAHLQWFLDVFWFLKKKWAFFFKL